MAIVALAAIIAPAGELALMVYAFASVIPILIATFLMGISIGITVAARLERCF